jgi:hypothetical protein
MKNMLSKSEIKLENMKMWLQEQIQRYKVLGTRTIDQFAKMQISRTKCAYETVLARLSEDEKC